MEQKEILSSNEARYHHMARDGSPTRVLYASRGKEAGIDVTFVKGVILLSSTFYLLPKMYCMTW